MIRWKWRKSLQASHQLTKLRLEHLEERVVPASADLAVTKTGPATALAGSNITYNLTVANRGPSLTTNAVVADTLPSGVSFVSANSSQGTSFQANGVVTERYKFIRAGFLQTALDSGSHWMNRPLLPNRLCVDVSLW